MIHNEAEVIKRRLGALKGVALVTRGWPKQPVQLPCIAIAKAADTPVTFGDDRAYMAQLEYYVRIFADRGEQADALAAEADAAMEELGYVRTFSYDHDDADVRMAVLRYRKYA